MDQEETFEILAGTYEEYTLGYQFTRSGEECTLKHTIATHAHRGSLKCIAVYNGPKHDLLVTGGSDETIYIYDLRYRKESGMLTNHTGTVTCLKFTPDGSHLLSASEDGSICIFKIGSWFLEKTWPKAHGGMSVFHLSVHPSGKLAMSIGADKTLKTWNLVKGRSAYTINLSRKSKRPDLVEWSLCGNYYGLVDDKTLNLFKVEEAGIMHTLVGNSEISDICFMKEDRVCIAYWSGSLTCYSCLTGSKAWEIEGNEMRLKAITYFQEYLISVNGQGTVCVYGFPTSGKPRKKATYETSCRVTCVAISKLLSEKERAVKKKKISSNATIKEELDGKANNKTVTSNKVMCVPKSQKWTVENAES